MPKTNRNNDVIVNRKCKAPRAKYYFQQRQKLRLLQKEVAYAAGICPKHYQQIEIGKRVPGLVIRYKLSRAMQMNFVRPGNSLSTLDWDTVMEMRTGETYAHRD